MSGNRTRERLLALVAGAALAFNYPLLYLFAEGGMLFGWPLLVVYLFLTWLIVIVMTALLMERKPSPPSDASSAEGTRSTDE